VVKLKVIDEGFNPIYGARPLRRAVMRLIEDKVASKFLQDGIDGPVAINISLDNFGEIKVVTTLTKEKNEEKNEEIINKELNIDNTYPDKLEIDVLDPNVFDPDIFDPDLDVIEIGLLETVS
jgi:hypothetical protein